MSPNHRLLVFAVTLLVVIGSFGLAAGDASSLAAGGDDHECMTVTATATATSDCTDDTTEKHDHETETKTETGHKDVTVEGEPDLEAFLSNNTVAPGDRTRLVVQLSNSGTVDDGGLGVPPEGEEAVTTARDIRVELEDGDAPVEVRTGVTPLGDLPAGSIAGTGFTIAVDEDADPGVYELDVEVDYEYTEEISNDERDDESVSETFEVKLIVTENARFKVVDVDEDLQVGESGSIELTLKNVGEEDLRDATVAIQSQNSDLQVDSGGDATRFTGDWEAGEKKTIEVEATAQDTAGPQRYALSAVVRYTDEDGDQQQSMPLPFGVRLDEEQTFSVDDVSGDLRVGEDGTVTGTVTNEGPEPVADVVVRLVDENGDVVARRVTSVVGDLDDGESKEFEIPVTVPGDAEPGERRLSFEVAYLNRDGDPRVSDPLFDTVDVEAERDRFRIEDVDEDLQVGETGTVELTLENGLPGDLRDATVTVQSPNHDLRLGAGGNATRYVGDWDAGDEETVSFEATAVNGSTPDRYPLRVTVSYTDEDGDKETSELLIASVSPAAEQRFVVRDVASTLRVGEEGRLNGTVVNRGPRSVKATVVRLVDTGPSVEARDTEVVLGSLSEDDSEQFSFPVSVLDTAQPGPRRVAVVVAYVTQDGDLRTSDPIPVVSQVSSETDQFELTMVEADLQADDDGDLELVFVNRGNETLSDATVSLTSRSSSVLVGDGVDDTRFVGQWSPGETRVVQYSVEAAEETGNQTFAFEASVTYEDDAGQPRTSDVLAFGATPDSEQTFDARTIESTLRVGEEGRVHVELTNTGPRNVSAVGIELVTETQNVNPVETAATVGDLAAGETATFELPIEISESADAGPRQLVYRIEYTDDDGDRRVTDQLTTDVRVNRERDTFVLSPEVVTVTAGDTTVVELTITNNRGVTLTDIQVKSFADDPLSVDDDQAFVPSLESNESATIRFSVSATAAADVKTYPLSVDFLYTKPDDDSELSKPMNVGVKVEEPPPSQFPWWVLPIVAVLLLVVVAAVLIRRRRRSGENEGDTSGDAPLAGAGDDAHTEGEVDDDTRGTDSGDREMGEGRAG